MPPSFYEPRWLFALSAAALFATGAAASLIRIRRLKRDAGRLRELLETRTAELLERSAQLEVANQALGELATLDSLTGLANRRRFEVFAHQEWTRARRTHRPLSMVLIDADFFKKYNDTYGHRAGDECLRGIASVLRAAAHRVTDLAARYGGEEFAVVLAETGAEGARLVAEEIRANIEALAIPHVHGPAGVVTISAGVATTGMGADESLSSLIDWCDKALYEAKAHGRNQVHAYAAHVPGAEAGAPTA